MAVPRKQASRTLDPKSLPTSSTLSSSQPNTASISRGVCDRISQWMWSGWSGCESNQSHSTNGSASRQPYQSDPADCKACREWHVPCDHSRPQCDHCYQQQLLCFYTNPDQKPKPKPKPKGHAVDLSTVPRIREPTPRKRL